MSNRLTKQELFEAAEAIIAKGRFPTLSGLRSYLGNRGSQTTIQKYFTQWKFKRFSQEKEDNLALLERGRLLEQALSESKTQAERYAKELIQSEKSLLALKEQLKLSQQECSTLKAELQEMTVFQRLYTELKEQQDLIFGQVMAEKNNLIDELREELKTLNEMAFEQIKEMSCQGHDALMAEKVNLINAQQKIIQLTERLNEAKELGYAVIRNNGYRNGLSHDITSS